MDKCEIFGRLKLGSDMKKPKRAPDFVYSLFEFWFDEMLEYWEGYSYLASKIKIDNGKFSWYNKDENRWIEYGDFNVPQSILRQEYGKWINKQFLK